MAHDPIPALPGSRLFGNLSEFRNDRIGLLHRIAQEKGDIARIRIGPASLDLPLRRSTVRP